MRLNILEWLRSKGYAYTWNVKLGGRMPDIAAFDDSRVLAFEFKKRASEMNTAVGQCLSYMQEANGAYVVLHSAEARKISGRAMALLQKNGIGLLSVGDAIKEVSAAAISERKNERLIEMLKPKALADAPFMQRSEEATRKRVKEVLAEHPEGMTMLRLADIVGVHRHTVTKYVYMMVGSGEIYQRELGPAKLCYLKVRLEQEVKAGEMIRKMKDEAAASEKSVEGS
jgi:hypothetical protein